jgi:D-glycero-alpha-D-manno-heptose-7-phosphate kinase
VIRASAPVRICDLGGWTDTWFGGPGRLLNLAVEPGVEVIVSAVAGPGRVRLDVEVFEDRYEVVPGERRPPRHPLLEAAIDAIPLPPDLDLELSVRSAVPAGSGCGTSAAVAVCLLGALTAAAGVDPDRRDIARFAHTLEVDVLGGESGVQDQLSSAFGGINFLEVDSYPEATVTGLEPWPDLSSRLLLVFVGRAHESSAVHRQVIEGTGTGRSGALEALRAAALAGRDAVVARDLNAFGEAMAANTEAQKALHPELVGTDAHRVIEAAQQAGAIGWKVNGAGGDGGSVTILSDTAVTKDLLAAQLAALDPAYEVSPVRISDTGLHIEGFI